MNSGFFEFSAWTLKLGDALMQAVCQCSLGQLSSPELAGLRAYPSILPLPAVRDVRSRPRGDQRVLGVAECLCLLICVY